MTDHAVEPREVVPDAPVWPRVRRHLTGWVFAFPFLAIFAVFLAIPIVASFALSFTGFGLANLQDWFSAPWVGIENYRKLFSDEVFIRTAKNTAVYVIVGVPFTLALGLVAALGLNRGLGKLQGVFRVGYYIPVVTSIVAIAVIWRYLLNPEYGIVNSVLGMFGIDGPNWLGEQSTALGSIVALLIWRNFGFDMVVYLAALQAIDPTLLEAARVDGANTWQTFRRITLPLLKPATLFLAVLTTAGYLQVFEEPFVMTNGGPLGSTRSVAMYVYEQGFKFLNLGYASAIAYALFVAIIVIAFIQFRLLRSDELR